MLPYRLDLDTHLSSGFFSSFTGVSCCHWINYSLEHQVQIKMYNTQQILKTNKDSLKRFDQYIVNIMIVKLAYILHLKTIKTNYLHCNMYYQSYLFIKDGIPSIIWNKVPDCDVILVCSQKTGQYLRVLAKSHRQLQDQLKELPKTPRKDLLGNPVKKRGSITKTRIVGKKTKRSSSTTLFWVPFLMFGCVFTFIYNFYTKVHCIIFICITHFWGLIQRLCPNCNYLFLFYMLSLFQVCIYNWIFV